MEQKRCKNPFKHRQAATTAASQCLTTLSTNCNCGASTVFCAVSIRCTTLSKNCTCGISTVSRPLLHNRKVCTLLMNWIWSAIENILDCWNLSLKEHKDVSTARISTPSSSMICSTTLENPSWEKTKKTLSTTPTAACRPSPPTPSRNPLLGLLGAALK